MQSIKYNKLSLSGIDLCVSLRPIPSSISISIPSPLKATSNNFHEQRKAFRSIWYSSHVVNRSIIKYPSIPSASIPSSPDGNHLLQLLLLSKGKRPRRSNTPSIQSSFTTLRTAPTTSALATSRHIRLISVASLSSRANGDRNPLNGTAPVFMPSRIHAVVDREVATNQVRAHRCILFSQSLRFANVLRLVFPVVDPDDAGVAAPNSIGFVGGICPVPASAEACTSGVSNLLLKEK